MKKIYFYFHAGSFNHGCEAIVRSTASLLNDRPILISANAESDYAYHVDQIVEVNSLSPQKYKFTDRLISSLSSRFEKEEKHAYDVKAKYESFCFEPNSVALSIGGDNYCYGKSYNLHQAGLNKYMHRRGIKTVLWGCSIEPSMVDADMKTDLRQYDLIAARESISYDFLKKINPHTVQICDPAFHLQREKILWPEFLSQGKIVGINLSPLIQKHEKESGITFDNYRKLISYILERTSYNIALIPHVVQEGNDDRVPLLKLKEEFAHSDRICMIPDCNCQQLKGVISSCAIFIGARTHATIAAYSSGIPTLVVGYSTKALGIARDLFGTSEHYVLPVQKLRASEQLTEAFQYLEMHSEEIQTRLFSLMPDYCKSIYKAVHCIQEL